MVKIAESTIKAVASFEKLEDICLFKGECNSTAMHLYIPKINARRFDNLATIEVLLEVVKDFSLPRLKVQKYRDKEKMAKLYKESRKTFRSYTTNTGELGEILLYNFLEGALRAPKILSKMSLKTAPGDYTKMSDGNHYLKLHNPDRYHIIFGEAKMYKNLSKGFKSAFKSIADHQSGKEFEKSLISSQIENEFIEEVDKKMINAILYPSDSEIKIKVSDAFGIFIGFEIDNTEGQTKTEDDYEKWVKNKIVSIVKSRTATIEKYITENKLVGDNFYVYLMPFIDLDESREEITKGVIE